MAEEDGVNFRNSPTEDFNPLDEDLPSLNSNICQQPDEDADLSSDDNQAVTTSIASGEALPNSVDETYFNTAAFSPPVSNARLMKREKNKYGKKQQTYKEFKSSMAMDKQRKPKTVVSVIRERYSESNALVSGLLHVDSDADLERDTSSTRDSKNKTRKERDEKQKSLTKLRNNDIYYKRQSVDMTPIAGNIASNTDPMDIHTPVVPIKLEGSGRFLSLGATVKSSLPLSPISSERSERRQPCTEKAECAKERVNFYKTFSVLINMGSHGKKKEQKEKIFAQRQKSSDEKIYMRFIWLGLQARLNGASIADQEKAVSFEIEKVSSVLTEIKNFKVILPQSVLNAEVNISDQVIPQVGAAGEIKQNRDSSCSVDTSVADISETYHTLCLSNEMIEQQQEAVIQVQKVLERLDRCEQLFPTSFAFAQEFPLYKEPAFVLRLEALYLWLNTTKDLCHKLKVLGQVLNVHSVLDSNWPYVDFDSPRNFVKESERERSSRLLQRSSIPEITKSGENEEGDTYSDDDTNDKQTDTSDREQLLLSRANDRKVSFNFDSPVSRTNSPKRDRSPMFGSPPDYSTPLKGSVSNNSLSRASSEASLDDICKSSMYRTYVDKGLKKMGLNKMLVRLRDILYRSLRRARQSLEQPHTEMDSMTKSPSDDYYHSFATSPSLDLLDKSTSIPIQGHTPAELHAWRTEFLEIGLPSYRPTYIFLLGVLLDVIHEAMNIRLEQFRNPIGEPSFLSLRQLIMECKDVLAKAVLVKQDYQCMVQAVLDDEEATAENSPLDLEKFDDDMSNMFKMYFKYLQDWLYHLQNLPEASRSLKNPLEEEWSFTKKICPHIIGGEAEAGKRFSTMAISLLNSISDFLDNGIDEYTTNLFDWTTSGELSGSEEGEIDSDDEPRDETSQRRTKTSLKKSFQKTCRNFKNLFHEARERASKALGFAKLLRKDLEIAADFNIAVSMPQFIVRLKETHHINVIAPLSAGYLMFIPTRIADQRRHIIQLLNVTCGREDTSLNAELSNKDEGYLLMVRCSGGSDGMTECPTWDGPSIKVEPTAETAIALSHLQVESLLLIVIHSSHLANQRRDFEITMGNTVQLVNEQTSCHQVIAESLIDLKASAIDLRDKVAFVVGQVEQHWNFETEMDDSEKKHILKLYRETMLQAYNFGFEYMKEVTRLVSGETRTKLGRGLMHFAKDWMKFVSEKCERGRGMRPRWANQGLDFLLVACEPRILAVLTEQEYQDLQESINDFISHLIGVAEKTSPSNHGGALPMPRVSSDSFVRQSYSRYQSWPAVHQDGKMLRSSSTQSVPDNTQNAPHSAPAAPYSQNKAIQSSHSLDLADGEETGMKKRGSDSILEVDVHDGEDGGLVMDVSRKQRAQSLFSTNPNDTGFPYNRASRIAMAIEHLDSELNLKLQNRHVIGHVTRNREVNYHINTRKVNFHWQKGNKIGEGQFGKVYSAVNMDTGELMAMKEMKFPTADTQRHFKEIIDEIKIFEGINHPNLVKYHGVEVHRTEMLVFMEYCDRGTIDDVSSIGLTEDLIRLYTRELLEAVQVLHDNHIVHRDIKGANIFLTSSGCLKLGDFGCSVKLKNHTTMAGEVNSLVGTTAYMAPEVITRTDKEGHGRAADIWSVGCVIIEMVSGKRPWHELESNFQIMFKLGMGYTPPIPENLGDEGKDFLTHCLEQDPDARWTASQLRDHPFAKIYDPEGDDSIADTSQA